MEEKIVKVTINIEESKITDLTDYATSLGGSVSAVEKQIKYEDLGIAETNDGKFQCLVCSSILSYKRGAISHFKKFHIDQDESKVIFPR